MQSQNKCEMASFQSLYNEIEYKIKVALAQIDDLKLENEILRTENEQLQLQQEEMKRQMNELDEKMKLSAITNTIIYKEDKKEIKKQINDWVREINNCIDLLKSK